MEITVKNKKYIVEDGVYIPTDLNNYPDNPDESTWHPKKICTVTIDENFPFLDKSFKGKFLSNFIYTIIFLLVFPLQKIRYGLKIEGKKNLRKNRRLFKNGAMTVSNHVYRWDYLAILQCVKYRKMWFIAKPSNLETSDGWMIRGAGGIPIAPTLSAGRKFNQAFDELHSKKKWIHVFPESCRWEFYQPIRPFHRGGFYMAYKYNIPVIPMNISFRKPTGIYKLFKVKHPLITVRIGEPILPDINKKRREETERLATEAHQQIVRMAKISKNLWQPLAEE